jgi:hypothetical protein
MRGVSVGKRASNEAECSGGERVTFEKWQVLKSRNSRHSASSCGS